MARPWPGRAPRGGCQSHPLPKAPATSWLPLAATGCHRGGRNLLVKTGKTASDICRFCSHFTPTRSLLLPPFFSNPPSQSRARVLLGGAAAARIVPFDFFLLAAIFLPNGNNKIRRQRLDAATAATLALFGLSALKVCAEAAPGRASSRGAARGCAGLRGAQQQQTTLPPCLGYHDCAVSPGLAECRPLTAARPLPQAECHAHKPVPCFNSSSFSRVSSFAPFG